MNRIVAEMHAPLIILSLCILIMFSHHVHQPLSLSILITFHHRILSRTYDILDDNHRITQDYYGTVTFSHSPLSIYYSSARQIDFDVF